MISRAWSFWIWAVTEHAAALGAAVVALSLVAIVGLSRISFDENPVSIFETGGDDFALVRDINAQFDTDENDVIVVVEGPELISPEALSALERLVERVGRLPDVQSTFSILNVKRVGSRLLPLVPLTRAAPERYDQARERALRHPLVAKQLLSDDSKTTLVIVHLRGESPPVSHVARVLEQLRQAIDESLAGTDLTARMAGHSAVRVENLATLHQEVMKFSVLGAAAAMVLGIVMLRRVAAMATVVCSSALGVLWTVGLMGFFGERINGLNMVLPTLVFVIGFSDAMHLMMHIQRALARGASRRDATVSGLEKLGTACLLCAVTTAAGFGSLMVAEAQSVQRFGLLCGIGSLLSFVATIGVLPVLATTRLGEFLSRPAAFAGRLPPISRLPLVAAAQRHPRATWIAGAVAAGICLAAATRLRPDIQWTEAIPQHSETSQAMRQSDEAFGGALLAYVVVEWPQRTDLHSDELYQVVDEVHQALVAEPLARGPSSVLSWLQALSRRTDTPVQPELLDRVPEHLRPRVIRPDLRRLLVSVHVPDVGAATLEPAFVNIEKRLAEIRSRHAGFDLELTGTVVVAARNMRFIIRDLARSVTSSAIVILLVLWAAFRSFRVAAISVLPNAFPLLFTAAYLVVTRRPLQITSVLTFSLCLGLAINDTVHFLYRLRQEQQAGRPLRAAVAASLDGVGPAMLASTIILTGGMVSMFASEMPGIRLFAELCCVTFVAAAFGDLVILPAMVLSLGRETPERDAAGTSAAESAGPESGGGGRPIPSAG